MKKILILGGFGFMGKNLNRVLDSHKYQIFNESRQTGCDMTNLSDLVNTIQKIQPNIIINAAAHVGSISYVTNNAANVVRDNSLMYLNLYEAVRQTNVDIKIINPISNCSYPGIIDIQNEEEWWNGQIHPSVESYGTPKKLGFIVSECYRKQYGINTVNLIISNSYGPYDYLDEERTHAMNGIVMRMIKAKNNNDTQFTIWGTGSPVREWIYMLDAAKIIKQIIDDEMFDSLPNPINLGQKFGVSIIDTVHMVKDLLQYDVEIVCDTTKQDGAPIKVLDNTLFNQYFPNFIFTTYQEGIAKTIEYYTTQLNKK
jgi:GDP-L-fucose synthase